MINKLFRKNMKKMGRKLTAVIDGLANIPKIRTVESVAKELVTGLESGEIYLNDKGRLESNESSAYKNLENQSGGYR